MVGIVGYTKFKNSLSKTRIQRMANAIRTNGDQRIDFFSHDYLDIALVMYPDLGFGEHAVDEDRSVDVIIYGKIFGFRHKLGLLKSKGYRFKDEGSSAEFILYAYKEWGNSIFCDLNGSFCLVISDIKVPSVLLVTDRFGTRPIYYAFSDGDLIFSSHCRAILEYPFPRKLNLKTLVKFLYYGRVGILGDETWFEGINLMPSASVLTFTEKGYTWEKYWDLIYSAQPVNEDELVKTLVKAFKKAVNIRVKGINGVSVWLSGGLDSRCVLSAIKENCKVTAVTFGIMGCDDITVAKKVTKRLGANHFIINYDPDKIVAYSDDVVSLTDGQHTVGVSYIPYVAEKMREKEIKYCLQGFIFDVLLGGSFLSREFFKAKSFNELLQALEKKYTLFQPYELKQLLNEKFHEYIVQVRKEFAKLAHETKGDSFPNRADYFNITTRQRRYTLMGSIPLREFVEEMLPTIDNEVIEVICRIPPELRFNYRIYRKFLFALNFELAKVPYQRTLVPPIMPSQLWRPSTLVLGAVQRLSRGTFRYKHSYFEFNEILRRHSKWMKLLKETLVNENALIYKFGYLNKNYVTKIVNEHFKRRGNNGEKIAFLMTLELLLQNFFGR
ncbi:MAG: asparagine synthase-related protein [Candidatus Bathyarchaeia archaeon]